MISDRPVLAQVTSWVPSQVWLANEQELAYKSSRSMPTRTINSGIGALEAFRALGHRNSDGQWVLSSGPKIIPFARRFGVLGWCADHNAPWTHLKEVVDALERGTPYPCQGFSEPSMEPLSAWRLWVARANAMLEVASAIQAARMPLLTDWQALFPDDDRVPGRPQSRRSAVLRTLNEWAALTDVGYILQWPEGQSVPSMTPRAHGALGVVVLDMVLAISNAKGFATCSECGRAYTPTREPRAGERHYCPNCRVQAGKRNAQREWRQRKREAAKAGNTDETRGNISEQATER